MTLELLQQLSADVLRIRRTPAVAADQNLVPAAKTRQQDLIGPHDFRLTVHQIRIPLNQTLNFVHADIIPYRL